MSYKAFQQNISRLMALLLCVILVFSFAPAVRAEGESGSCGSNLTWSLSAGTLTISGSGAMTDFPESTMAPWYPHREEILRLELPSGLTSIGNLAFYSCKNLTSAVIPDSVTKIGNYAFAQCQNLQILSMGSGVRTIGESAFSDCYALTSLQLPSGLSSIGRKGFYRCETITSVTVPSSVTYMGVSVFAYCKSLVTANINATIKTLPEYTFYGCELLASVKLPDTTENVSAYSFRGCDQLNTVYYGGTSQDVSELHSAIGSELPNFSTGGTVTDVPPSGAVSSSTMWQDENGNYNQSDVTVTTNNNSSVASKVEQTYHPDGTELDNSADVTVNINNQAGWQEVQNSVTEAIDRVSEKTDNVTVNVYVKETGEIDSDFMETMAEKNVTVSVTTDNGSSWVVRSDQWNNDESSRKYNLRYTITAGAQALSEKLDGKACFELTFAQSSKVNSEVLIHLGSSWISQEATLVQLDKDEVIKIQTTVVDQNGYAHFYLAAVDKDAKYVIGINLFREAGDPAPIIPELSQTNSNAVHYNPVRYEITGRTSSWGMGLGQVMGILAAVMVSVIVLVGVVMYIWNKKRLMNGYVPDWDDDDE